MPERLLLESRSDTFTPGLSDLVDGQFVVRRGDGSVDNGGWSVVTTHTSADTGEQAVVIARPYPKDSSRVQLQTVPLHELLGWQTEAQLDWHRTSGIAMAGVALREMEPEGEIDPNPKRLELLFEPRVSVAKMPEPEYDYLFAPDDSYGVELTLHQRESANIAAEQRNMVVVTDETRKDALDALQQSLRFNPELNRLISGAHPEALPGSLAMVDAIRLEPGLRMEIGKYFLDKISRRVATLPERLRDNTEKSPRRRGYAHIPRLTSREYVALLCLAMLDGSFDSQSAASDPITYDSRGEVEFGQHRSAARDILFRW